MQGRIHQFTQDYAVPLMGTLLVLILLVLLLLLRYVELAGIDNFGKANPLISTASNGLISHDQLASLNPDADNAQRIGTPTSPQTTKSQQTTTTTTASGETTTTTTTTSQTTGSGSGTSGTTTGTSGSGTDTGGNVDPTPEPFKTDIRGISHFAIPMSTVVGMCSVQHKFEGVIAAYNGPGSINYQWRQSNGFITPPQTIPAPAGDSLHQIQHNWLINEPAGPRWIDLMIMSPTPAVKRLSFTHQC